MTNTATRAGRPGVSWLIASLMVLGSVQPAAAQNGEIAPITDNDWTLEVHQGSVVGSPRIVGLGGAYVGVAEGMEGVLYNFASAANRPAHSQDWFEWDLSVTAMIAPNPGDNDILNDGALAPRFEEMEAGIVSLGMQFGRFGFGIASKLQRFTVGSGVTEDGDNPDELGESVVFTAQDVKLAFGWAALQEELLVGFGLRVGDLDATDPDLQRELTLLSGSTLEAGVLWRPREAPWRLGVAVRTASEASRAETADELGEDLRDMLGDRFLPDGLIAPAELAVGGSWMFGPGGEHRNRRREDPEMPDRRGILVAVDVLITDKPGGGVADRTTTLSGFIEQRFAPTLDKATMSVRAGAESEVWPDRLKVRGGSYLEPARTEVSDSRLHFTGGFDVRLIELWWWMLKLSAVADVAPEYTNTVFSLGVWH